jgi:zinc/manganese transport system permease protein
VTGLVHLFSHPFLVHALLAGTAVAVLCGLAGYFVVQRGEVFAGDALGHVAYTGAMAALAVGINPWLGLFTATVVAGLALGFGGKAVADDVTVGSFFSWILGLGVLFLTFYTTHRSTSNGSANVNALFGSIFGISAAGARTAVLVTLGAVVVLLVIARPLLFATVDPAVARAAGVPVRIVGAVFLAVVGVTVAEATQIVGAIVVLGLLAAPAAAARLTARPWPAFWLAAALAVGSVWSGIVLAYIFPSAPASFTIMAVAAGSYVLAVALDRVGRYRGRGRAAVVSVMP